MVKLILFPVVLQKIIENILNRFIWNFFSFLREDLSQLINEASWNKDFTKIDDSHDFEKIF